MIGIINDFDKESHFIVGLTAPTYESHLPRTSRLDTIEQVSAKFVFLYVGPEGTRGISKRSTSSHDESLAGQINLKLVVLIESRK